MVRCHSESSGRFPVQVGRWRATARTIAPRAVAPFLVPVPLAAPGLVVPVLVAAFGAFAALVTVFQVIVPPLVAGRRGSDMAVPRRLVHGMGGIAVGVSGIAARTAFHHHTAREQGGEAGGGKPEKRLAHGVALVKCTNRKRGGLRAGGLTRESCAGLTKPGARSWGIHRQGVYLCITLRSVDDSSSALNLAT